MIELTEADGDNYAISVHNEAGAVIASAGPALRAPTMVRSFRSAFPVPLSVGSTPRAAFAPCCGKQSSPFCSALFSPSASTSPFASSRSGARSHRRGAGRRQRAIDHSNKQLHVQNERFDAALTNMSQGLCMFDANGKLVIFNPRFAEIYGLPTQNITPGMTTRELMALAFGPGKISDIDPEGTLALRENIARERKAGSMVERLTDGRIIAISYRPMPSGGFVVTFEDITERLLAEEKIKHMAHYDALTDLPNRVTFYERMDAVLGHLRRAESIAGAQPRSRPFQERQRYARTSGRRPFAAGGGRAHAQLRPQRRHRRPIGRGRVCHRAGSVERAGGSHRAGGTSHRGRRRAVRYRRPSSGRGGQRRHRHRAERRQTSRTR